MVRRLAGGLEAAMSWRRWGRLGLLGVLGVLLPAGGAVRASKASPRVELELSTTMVHPGETFQVVGHLVNPGPEDLPETPTVFALEVFGEYWFWPSWARYAPPEHTGFDWALRDVPVGRTSVTVVPAFTWPATGNETVTGLHFLGALLEPDLRGILGEFAQVAWGYGPAGGPTPTPTPFATAPPSPSAPPASSTPVPGGLLQPEDLVYQGAFAFPPGDEWTYSGHALGFSPTGDPDGGGDGYPGSLFAAGHTWDDLVGEFTIPAPAIAESFEELPRAEVLTSLRDITGGWIGNCTYAPECIYREVDGLAVLPPNTPGGSRIVWNLRDWYNVAGYDQDSLGWSNLDMSDPRGVWHIGRRPDPEFHNARTCNYLFLAPSGFAQEHLEGKWLIAGNHREAGAFGGSQGPTLYALDPWSQPAPPPPGAELDALPLLYYPEQADCLWEDPESCLFPGYRASDQWNGGAWIQRAGRRGVLIFGRKALGENCYGTVEECGEDPCNPDKGYHAYPYEPWILFYDPEELRQAAAGRRDPWETLPYAVFRPTEELFNPECGVFGAVAQDRERGIIYATEQMAGPWGETAVHVWTIRD